MEDPVLLFLVNAIRTLLLQCALLIPASSQSPRRYEHLGLITPKPRVSQQKCAATQPTAMVRLHFHPTLSCRPQVISRPYYRHISHEPTPPQTNNSPSTSRCSQCAPWERSPSSKASNTQRSQTQNSFFPCMLQLDLQFKIFSTCSGS